MPVAPSACLLLTMDLWHLMRLDLHLLDDGPVAPIVPFTCMLFAMYLCTLYVFILHVVCDVPVACFNPCA